MRHRLPCLRPTPLAATWPIATIPRRDGAELRIEVQQARGGFPYVSCRLWVPGAVGCQRPLRNGGFGLRRHEIAPLVEALKRAGQCVDELSVTVARRGPSSQWQR